MTRRLGLRGDEGARANEFELLVQPHVEEMYRVGAAIVGQDDAQDVAQQALLAAWRGWPRLRDRASLRPWLYSILVNTCRNHLRARKRRPRPLSLERDPVVAAIQHSAANAMADHLARRDALDRAFERLSAEQRAVLALRYTLDLPVHEVAVRLGIPEGTVKSRLHIATGELRRQLTEDADHE
jgi:RNA polymerase sigma-70 factor, ECF subfamily